MTTKKNRKVNPGTAPRNQPRRRAAQITRPSRAGASSQKPVHVHLSNCTKNYASSLCDPFSGPVEACVPATPAVMSRKVRVKSRGSFSTGANSFGFISVDPQQAVGSNSPSVFYTNGTAAALTAIDNNSGTAGVSQALSDSDYVAASFGNTSATAQYRVVSAGLRIKYSGTKLNQGGWIYGLQEPTHDSLQGKTITTMMAYDDAVKIKVDDNWTELLYRPIMVSGTLGFNDFGFRTTTPSTGADQSALAGSFYLAMIVQSAVASQPFDYEFYVNFEATGPNVRGMTKSHSDPLGLAGASDVLATNKNFRTMRSVSRKDTKETAQSFWEEIGEAIVNGISWVGNVLGEGVRAFEKGAGLIALAM